ncbi:unnamed protein product [Rhizopus stolonifer]
MEIFVQFSHDYTCFTCLYLSVTKLRKKKLNTKNKYRVYLGYHTVNQVIVGSLAGSFFGLFWYAIVNKLYSSKWIDFIVDSSLAKRIYLRDSRSIDNVAKWEYIQWTKAKKSS